jgi:hypothetical protein
MVSKIFFFDVKRDYLKFYIIFKADRAKQIKTKAVVNEDPTEKLIHDLKAENAKLKEMLANGKADPALIASLSVQPNGASDCKYEILIINCVH